MWTPLYPIRYISNFWNNKKIDVNEITKGRNFAFLSI